MPNIDPKVATAAGVVAAGAAATAVVGAAVVAEIALDDDATNDPFDLGDDTSGDGSFDSFGSDEYDPGAYDVMSEMSEMQHQTNMEIIDNMGGDDYYYETTPDDSW